MFDAYGGVMGDYVHYLLVSLAMDKIERSGDRNAKLGRADLGTIHVSEILYEGKTLLIPDFEWTYALSPLLDYSFDRHVGLQKALLNLLNSFATDRHKRREYQNSVRKTVPSNSPFYEPLMSVYNASLLFRSLYSSSAQFMGLVTDYMRVAEIDQIRGLVLLPPQERLKRITVTTESIEADKQRVKAVLHYGYPDLQEGIERLKQADREIPRELAIFKTFPYVSELMNTHGGKDYARSERSVLFRVLDAYRIDPGVFMEMLDSAILRAAQAYTDFVGQQGVSGGTQSIPTGTASVVEPQVSPEPSVPGAKGRGSALMPAVARMFDAYGRVVDMYVRRALTSLIDLNFPEKSRVVEIGESDFGLMLINNHGSSLVTSLDSLNPSFSEGRKAPFVCVDQIEHGSNVFCFPTMFNLRFLSQMYGYEPYRMLATYSAWVGMLDGFSKNKEARLEYLRELRRALPQSSPLFPLLETVYQSSELLQSLYTQAQFIDSMTVVMRRADTLTLEHLAMGSSAERDRQLQLIRRRTDILAEHVKAVFRYSQSAHDKQFFSALADLKKADAGLPPEIPFFRSFPQVSGLLACETPADSERRVLFDVLDRCGIDRETYMGLQDYAVLCGANAFGEWTGDQRVEGLAELFERYAPFFEPLAEVQLQGAETPSQETVARQLNPLQRIGGLLGRYLPKVNLHIG
ncbi:hypothetical protein HYV82_03030 [Candidatus Woesearchaeota archaeon]|nr:hypothetical protein [Candidatus Woesearchaeota archaeon]